GDFITDGDPFEVGWMERQLRRVSSAAPSFATLGNHDGGPWAHGWGGLPTTEAIAKLVTSSGLSLLQNKSIEFQGKDRGIQLVGLGDLWAGEFEPARAFPAPSATQNIVLSHNPDTKDLLGDYSWDLM